MRNASPKSTAPEARMVRPASHTHSARKTSNSNPAKACGSPKRSRVKNPLIGRRGVFYHVWRCSGNFSYGRTKPSVVVRLEERSADRQFDSATSAAVLARHERRPRLRNQIGRAHV